MPPPARAIILTVLLAAAAVGCASDKFDSGTHGASLVDIRRSYRNESSCHPEGPEHSRYEVDATTDTGATDTDLDGEADVVRTTDGVFLRAVTFSDLDGNAPWLELPRENTEPLVTFVWLTTLYGESNGLVAGTQDLLGAAESMQAAGRESPRGLADDASAPILTWTLDAHGAVSSATLDNSGSAEPTQRTVVRREDGHLSVSPDLSDSEGLGNIPASQVLARLQELGDC